MSADSKPRQSGRDGFVVVEYDTGHEVDFIACEMDGRMREKVEAGLLRKVDLERFYFQDTRDESSLHV